MSNHKKICFYGILIFTILLTGCKTRNMHDISRIPIASGLNTQEVVSAVIASAGPIETSVRRLPRGPIRSYEDGRWSVEDASDNFVILNYGLGPHIMRVRFEVEGREIVPTIISSQNLKMSEKRIHKNAIVWINRHGAIIREAMWKVKQARGSEPGT